MATSRLGHAYAAVEKLPRSLTDNEVRRVAYFLAGYAPEAFLHALARGPVLPDLAAYAREALAELERLAAYAREALAKLDEDTPE